MLGPGLFCLIVSVRAGLAGFVLSWFGRPGIPYTWSGLIAFALLCFAHLVCIVAGMCVVVELSLVLIPLVRSGVVHSSLL